MEKPVQDIMTSARGLYFSHPSFIPPGTTYVTWNNQTLMRQSSRAATMLSTSRMVTHLCPATSLTPCPLWCSDRCPSHQSTRVQWKSKPFL